MISEKFTTASLKAADQTGTEAKKIELAEPDYYKMILTEKLIAELNMLRRARL